MNSGLILMTVNETAFFACLGRRMAQLRKQQGFTQAQLADIGRPKWSAEQLVLKSWADGTRNIYDITRLAVFETGAQLDLNYTLTLFKHYARQGLVSLAHGT